MTPEEQNRKDNALYDAIPNESPEQIAACIKEGADVNFRLPPPPFDAGPDTNEGPISYSPPSKFYKKPYNEDLEGTTVLQHAIFCNRADLVEKLLTLGADPFKCEVSNSSLLESQEMLGEGAREGLLDAFWYAAERNFQETRRTLQHNPAKEKCIDMLIRDIAKRNPEYNFLEGAGLDSITVNRLLDMHQQNIISLKPTHIDKEMIEGCKSLFNYDVINTLLDHPAIFEHYKKHPHLAASIIKAGNKGFIDTSFRAGKSSDTPILGGGILTDKFDATKRKFEAWAARLRQEIGSAEEPPESGKPGNRKRGGSAGSGPRSRFE